MWRLVVCDIRTDTSDKHSAQIFKISLPIYQTSRCHIEENRRFYIYVSPEILLQCNQLNFYPNNQIFIQYESLFEAGY